MLSVHHETSKSRERWIIFCFERILSEFQNFYFPSKIIQQLINKIVQEELAQEVDDDIELQENIMKEILDNWDQWQSEEFERSMEWGMTDDPLFKEIQVFCPVCQRNLLSLNENIISCDCGIQ